MVEIQLKSDLFFVLPGIIYKTEANTELSISLQQIV